MPKKDDTLSARILSTIFEIGNEIGKMMPMPLETPYGYIRRASRLSYPKYYRATYGLRKRNAVEAVRKNGKVFLKLTRKGELEVLCSLARSKPGARWDGKWRIIIFDIPEKARKDRDQLRLLLKRISFKKLQASVFVSPFALNREAIEYLRKTKLIDYIRILRVDEVDDDKDLRKLFKLN